MIGKINIIGDIGSYEDEQGNLVKGVDLLDVVAMVEAQKALGALSLEVVVDSLGGFCDVGFSIHDYLKSISLPVKTIAQNRCASIATVIWFCGDQRAANCHLMIHNPWISGVKGDADKIQEAADHIRAEEEKLISFYSKATGLGKVELDALMKQETYISPEEAFNLKFSTEAPTIKLNTVVAYKAVAKINDTMSKETKGLISKMDEVLTAVKNLVGIKPKAKALLVLESGGKSIEITNADGTDLSGLPMAGNLVMIDGAAAPDGHYVLTDLSIEIDVAAGIVTTVTEVAQAGTDENLAAALKEIAELKAEKESAKVEAEENKKDNEAMKAKVVEFENILKSMQGKADLPPAKNQFRDIDAEKSVADYKKEAKEREEKLNSKK